MSVRSQKVGSEVRKALSTVMDTFAREHGGGLLTITNVIMSPDLSVAKVYISIFGSAKSQEEVLKSLAIDSYLFRKVISSQLRLRIVPEVRFYADNSLDDIDRITQILKANPPFHELNTPDGDEDIESNDE